MTASTKSQRITPENQPQFPCWLYHLIVSGAPRKWIHHEEEPAYPAMRFVTHWHPDQPDAPQEVPDATPGHGVAPDGKPWPSQLAHLATSPAPAKETIAPTEELRVPANTPDWERIEVIRRADWISSPTSSVSSGGEWRVHVSLRGSGQTTACGKTLIEAIDRANDWFKRSMGTDRALDHAGEQPIGHWGLAAVKATERADKAEQDRDFARAECIRWAKECDQLLAQIADHAGEAKGADEGMPWFGPCCANPPVEGKLYNLVLDDDEMPPHIHSYRSIQEHLKASLEMLDDGDEITLKITRKDMTRAELDALPDL